MRTLLVGALALTVGLVFTGDTASAQCGYRGGYYRGSGLSIGYSNYSPRSSFSIGYNNYPRVRHYSYGYRSRGHYDRHPASFVRHRSHYHVRPGHWDYHRGRRYHHHH